MWGDSGVWDDAWLLQGSVGRGGNVRPPSDWAISVKFLASPF